MAIILVISYFGAIIYNLLQKEKDKRFPLIYLFIIGVLVQLLWESALLIGGIRSDGFTLEVKIQTLIVNSLLETNLGVVPIYVIYLLITSHLTENLKKRNKLTFTERMKEANNNKYRSDIISPQFETITGWKRK